MSSKLTVKNSRKDRPRSSDKLRKGKRDGTPDKPSTPNPSHDALLEEGMLANEKKPVIMGDDILAMQIKPEDLEKLHELEPHPPAERKRSPPACSVVVRKLKPASEWDKPKPKMVTVAKPAPPDAPLKPIDYLNGAGPRFNAKGDIIPHSILGDVDEFKQMALEKGHLPPELAGPASSGAQGPLPVKEKKRPVSKFPQFESVEKSNALRNWQKRMQERRHQQGHLARLLNKAPDQLVMNQSDSYRKTQELRYLIDRTVPTMDYGKGYRIGSEFWKQQEPVGDDLTGIHMTLSQTKKGYPPPILRVGVPKTVLEEKGTNWARPRTPFHKPWHKTPYLQERRAQLRPVMSELDPHTPDLLNLEVVGRQATDVPLVDTDDIMSETGMTETMEQREEFEERELDPLCEHPDVYQEPVIGPSMQFAGQPARWTGSSNGHEGQTGLEARVTFETFAGKRTTSFLEVLNDGTTTIYYDWKRIPKNNPFDVVNRKVQRFYFNTSGGVILPGDTMKFPFVFKSPNAGVFSEQWEFQTHPVVCGGAALVVTLRGIALQEDKYKTQRSQLEEELSRKQAEQVVQGILDELLDGIRSPERPKSAVDAYITQEEIFTRKNPGLYYSAETMQVLRLVHTALQSQEKEAEKPQEGEENENQEENLMPEWDLCVETLKEEVMALEEEDVRQDLLQKVNAAIISLSFPPFNPTQQSMYNVGYQLLGDAAERLVSEAVKVRLVLGMPDPSVEEANEPVVDTDLASESQHPPPPSTPAESDGKRGSPSKSGAAKPDPRDKKAKDSKAAVTTKSAAKEAPKGAAPLGGKITPGPGKRPSTRERAGTAGSRATTPGSGDPVMDNKYQEKLYAEVCSVMGETLDHMSSAFETIVQKEGQGVPPSLL